MIRKALVSLVLKALVSLVLLAGLAVPAHAQVPNFPQTLPANTVVGRLGIGPGATQAIPFGTLTSNLFNGLCTTDGAAPIYNASTASWVCSTATKSPLTINPTAA